MNSSSASVREEVGRERSQTLLPLKESIGAKWALDEKTTRIVEREEIKGDGKKDGRERACVNASGSAERSRVLLTEQTFGYKLSNPTEALLDNCGQ